MTSSEPQASPCPRALLAEDDTLIRELVSGYLETLGFVVQQASNGKIALDLLTEEPPNRYDLLVTDILMPKANGDQLIATARKHNRCEHFLVMSGNLVDTAPDAIIDGSDSEYIEKPFTFRDFEAKLNSLGKALAT